jgi:hypothetical protein
MRIRIIVPAQMQEKAEPPTVQTTPAKYLAYDESIRLSLSTMGQSTGTFRSGKTGLLVGVTVFASAVDLGDTYSITLKGRALKSSIYPVANFAQAEGFEEPVEAGDTLMIIYNSQGTTVKTIDFTPRIKYDPSVNP